MRWTTGIFGLTALAALLPVSVASAQNVDSKLADGWAFMQKAMPGVPYSTLEGACKEGNLMIYAGTWTSAQEAQIAKFKEHFPCISVQTYSALNGARRQRFKSETSAGRYIADIIQDTQVGALNQEAKDGLLMNYKISNDDSFAKGAKNPGYWYALRIAMVGIAWNTNLVSADDAKILQNWKSIADPRWKGKASVVNPVAGGVSLLPWFVWEKLYGDDFIKTVGENKPRVMSGTNPAAAALAAGDVSVLFNASETGLLPLQLKGAPIQWSLPSPGIGPLTGQAIATHAPHPDAAKLYQEYAFTLEGYQVWQKLGGAPARKSTQDQRSVAKQPWYHLPDEIYNADPAEVTKDAPAVRALFNKLVAGQ